MRRLSSTLPSPAMLVALLALFVALGGSAYAVKAATAPANSVVTKSIKKGAVTRGKIALGAVGSAQIGTGAVGAAHLGAGAVGTGQLADGAVTGAKLGKATITAANIDLASLNLPKSTTYTVRRAVTDHAFAIGGQFQQLVSCLTGEKVTGGGGYASNGRITISQSIPFVGADEQRWGVQLFNGSGEAITAQVNTYVVCASA